MKYNQNSRIMQVTDITLVIGVDIAKKKHYARAFTGGELNSIDNRIQVNLSGF